MNEKNCSIQTILGVTPDGKWGPLSEAALRVAAYGEWTYCKASSFADPVDVARFLRCKGEGKTDMECFKVGDNGVGLWGDDCTVANPICALPPEDWHPLGKRARGAKVLVRCGADTVICELRDTMPKKQNIHNGAGIDLNLAACQALGLIVPTMAEVSWKYLL